MFALNVEYPSVEEELRIGLMTTREESADVAQLLDATQVLEAQKTVRRLQVSEHVGRYAVSLVRATRPRIQRPTGS